MRTRTSIALHIALLTAVSVQAAERTQAVPDLQGMWISGTLTPLERPAQLADKAHFTTDELDEQQRAADERYWAAGHRAGDVGRDNDAFLDHQKILPSGQTSLIISPTDGLLPLQPEAVRRRDFNLQSFDTFETMSQWDRCITREPTTMLPVNYNNAYQIVQTPDYVVIHTEMIHDARIISLRGAHTDSRVRSWGGDSRGHWDGATLVIDTRNFNDIGWIATGANSGRLRGVPYGKDLHIVERMTLVDRNTLDYAITIEDPQSFTAPLIITYPLARDDSYRMFEYACHEGNSAVESILRGARVQEAAAASR